MSANLSLTDVRPLPATIDPDVDGMTSSERRLLAITIDARRRRVAREFTAIEERYDSHHRWIAHHDDLIKRLEVCEAAYAPRKKVRTKAAKKNTRGS